MALPINIPVDDIAVGNLNIQQEGTMVIFNTDYWPVDALDQRIPGYNSNLVSVVSSEFSALPQSIKDALTTINNYRKQQAAAEFEALYTP